MQRPQFFFFFCVSLPTYCCMSGSRVKVDLRVTGKLVAALTVQSVSIGFGTPSTRSAAVRPTSRTRWPTPATSCCPAPRS